jgi:hypothetical protein
MPGPAKSIDYYYCCNFVAIFSVYLTVRLDDADAAAAHDDDDGGGVGG